LAKGKILIAVVATVLICIYLAFTFISPLSPGPVESNQITPRSLKVNSNTVSILDNSETGNWAGVALHKVSLVVNKQFENNVPIWYGSNFMVDSTVRILAGLGIEVVNKLPFDATVTINVTGGADWYGYNTSGKAEDGGTTNAPTAAHATVLVSITNENRENSEFVNQYRTLPLSRIVGDYPLALTPMDEAIAGALVPDLAKIWGENVCINAMTDSDELISWAGVYAIYSNCSIGDNANPYLQSGGWDTISPNTITALLNAYEHSPKKTSEYAYDTLDTITAGYIYDPFPNLLPTVSPKILDLLKNTNPTGINFDSQGNITSITPDAIPIFIQLLGNNNMLIRVASAQTLSKLGPVAIPALSKAVTDNAEINYSSAPSAGNSCAAIAAIYSLKCIGSESIPALIDATNSPGVYSNEINFDRTRMVTVFVREVAIDALKSVGSKDMSPLKADLENENYYVRLMAAKTLGNIGPKAREAIPALIQALNDEDGRVRAAASYALYEITGNYEDDASFWQEWLTSQK
jgi:hypothetical protein